MGCSSGGCIGAVQCERVLLTPSGGSMPGGGGMPMWGGMPGGNMWGGGGNMPGAGRGGPGNRWWPAWGQCVWEGG
jgi:hypothetical protein